MKNRYVFLFLFLSVAAIQHVFSQKNLRLTKFESPNASLVYLNNSGSYLVPHTIRAFENAMTFHQNFWGYYPSGKTNILFNDFTDIGNGGTMVLPFNYLNIAVSPFDYSFSVIPSNERMSWLMNHELTHQVMCDQASHSDRRMRKWLGGKVYPDNKDPFSLAYSYFTTPRWYSPRWYHEGIAVFMETWMSGGLGRTLGGYDEMVFRTMVHDSAYFYNVIGLETEGTAIDFQVGVNAYLYGTRFVGYLAATHGVGKLKQFYARTDSSRRYYANQFKNVYGTPIQEEWDNWIASEQVFQKQNLKKIREFPLTAFRAITSKPIGSASRQFYIPATNQLVMAVNYPGKLAHISIFDLKTGQEKVVAPVPSPGLYYVTSIAYDDSYKRLFVSTHNHDWRGLESIDLNTGKREILIKYSRMGNLVINPEDHSLWGVQTSNGRNALVRLAEPYNYFQTVYSLPYGQDLSDPAISPDGSLLSATLSNALGAQKVVIFNINDLLAGIQDYRVLYEFEDNPAANFVFSPDGKYLYGTSYYTGVSNVYRISVETKQAEILTNAETGFFRPLPVSEDSMIVFKYTHEGMVPGMVKIEPVENVNPIELLGMKVYEKNPVVEKWALPPPSSVNLDSLNVTEERYRPFSSMKLAGAYPILQGYKSSVAVGYRVNFLDPMGLNALVLKLSVSPKPNLPDKEKLHLSAEYNYWNWAFAANYNYADFYDLFGPTKFSRAGYSFSGKYYKLFNRFNPNKTDFYVKLTAYGDLEKLPYYQNVSSDYRNLYILTVNYHKSYLRKSLGAIEPEQGYDWNVYAFTSFAKATFYPQLINNFDLGFLLPMRNSSLWLRSSAGYSFGEADKSNSYFYFGGFGNNYVDYRQVQQYRDMSAFPGVEINEFSSLNYGKLTTELNLTPLRFKRAGMKSLYTTYARLSLLGMAMVTDIYETGDNITSAYYTAGAQLDFEIVLFSLLKSTLSFGYARAFGDVSKTPADEFMISLKL